MRKFLNQYETEIVIGFVSLCAVVLEATVVIALKF
jgi:hypothetical protein